MSETKQPGRPKLPSKKCLTPDCEMVTNPGVKGLSGARGLCKRCHLSASSMVKRKITTWEELESYGLAEPKYGSIVERALRKAKALKLEGESE